MNDTNVIPIGFVSILVTVCEIDDAHVLSLSSNGILRSFMLYYTFSVFHDSIRYS